MKNQIAKTPKEIKNDCPIQKVKSMELKPGDLIVIKVKREAPRTLVKHIAERARRLRAFKDCEVLVLDSGVTIETYRQEQPESVKES